MKKKKKRDCHINSKKKTFGVVCVGGHEATARVIIVAHLIPDTRQQM